MTSQLDLLNGILLVTFCGNIMW